MSVAYPERYLKYHFINCSDSDLCDTLAMIRAELKRRKRAERSK